MKIPELSLSPRCMLRPVMDIMFIVRLSSVFLIDALDAYAHYTLGIVQPFRSKVFVAYQSSAVSASMLCCFNAIPERAPQLGDNILYRYS